MNFSFILFSKMDFCFECCVSCYLLYDVNVYNNSIWKESGTFQKAKCNKQRIHGTRKAYCVDCVYQIFHVFHFNDNQSIKLCVHFEDIKGSTTLYTTHSLNTCWHRKHFLGIFFLYFLDNTSIQGYIDRKKMFLMSFGKCSVLIHGRKDNEIEMGLFFRGVIQSERYRG